MAAIEAPVSLFKGKNLQALMQVLGVKLAAVIFGLGLMAMLARVLDTTDFGHYILLFSMVTFFGLIVQFGLGTAAMRLISNAIGVGKHQVTLIIMRGAVIRVFIIGIVFSGIWISGFGTVILETWAIPSNWPILIALVIWIFLSGFQKLLVEILRGFQKTTLASLFDNTTFSVLMVGIIGLVFVTSYQPTLNSIVLLAAICMALSVGAALFILQNQIGFLHRVPTDNPIAFFGVATPILATELAVFFNTQADIWIIATILPVEYLAPYAVVIRVVMMMMLPTVIVVSIVAPKIIQTRKGDLQQLLSESAFMAAAPTLAFFLFVLIFGQSFLTIVFGPSFGAGYPVLVILSAGRAVNVLTGLCGPCLMLLGHHKLMMGTTIFATSLATISAIIVAKPFGIIGVAICFSVAMAVQNVLQALLVQKLLGVCTLVRISPFKRQSLA